MTESYDTVAPRGPVDLAAALVGVGRGADVVLIDPSETVNTSGTPSELTAVRTVR